MPNYSFTKTIIEWVDSTPFESLPQDVKKITQLALYDGIGSALACSMLPIAHHLMKFIKLAGDGPNCTVIGFPQRTSVLNAALVNGTLGHADEVDAIDDFDTRGSHVLATTIAASLAAGQISDASGSEILRSIALGYEVSKRVQAVAASVKKKPGGHFGPFDESNTMGATVAAGISLGLNADQMDVAISLAAHLACGITPFRREANHMAKSFTRGGAGAQNGVTAALMAKSEYDAPRNILEGPDGFFDSYLGVTEPGSEFLEGLGKDFSIRGLIFKRNCSGGGLQAPRQTILEIMTENSLCSDDILDIQIGMRPSDINSYFTSQRHPADCGDALAIAILYGGMGFKEAHQKRFSQNPQVKEIRSKIHVNPREDWVEGKHRLHTTVTVTAEDGRQFFKESNYRKMTESDLDAKFSYLVGLRVGKSKAEELADLIKLLNVSGSISNILANLEYPELHIEDI